jgi:uncharacterized protein YndB with AHSA1/START domain
MTERSVTHSTFVIERTYAVPPARVFAAFADPMTKARWFARTDEWGPDQHTLDFRVGGRETSRGGPPGGPVHSFDGRYHEIVPDRRIIFAYDLSLDETLISVSLATVEFQPEGSGTRLIFTEQGAFLESYDDPAERERGFGALLDALGAVLERESART